MVGRSGCAIVVDAVPAAHAHPVCLPADARGVQLEPCNNRSALLESDRDLCSTIVIWGEVIASALIDYGADGFTTHFDAAWRDRPTSTGGVVRAATPLQPAPCEAALLLRLTQRSEPRHAEGLRNDRRVMLHGS